MKTILFLSAFVSTIAFAQESCLKTTESNGQVISLCSAADADNISSFHCGFHRPVCFTGEAKELVAQINAFVFVTGDAALGGAQLLNNDEISFGYGDVGTVCEPRVATRCSN